MDIIHHITTEEQFKKIIEDKSTPKILFFCGINCNPCRKLCPMIEDRAINLDGKFIFVKICSSKFSMIANDYEFESFIPYVVLLKNGKIADKFDGYNLEKMEKMLSLI